MKSKDGGLIVAISNKYNLNELKSSFLLKKSVLPK